jgi:FKBP-type peptidyl-prolyl cis-trans isomerase SlyD
MKITKNNVVIMHYAVSDSEGTLIDSSYDEKPMAIIQGTGYLIPGLDDALLDHKKGSI